MATLIHDIENHAKDKANVVYTLGLLFATELNPIGWQAFHAGKGNNSWRMYLRRNGKPTLVWFFTGYGKGAVVARDDYYWDKASQQIEMKTRVDAIKFVRSITSQK